MDDKEELPAVTAVEPPVVNSEWDDGIDIKRLQVTTFPSAGEYQRKRKKKFPPLIGENKESDSDGSGSDSNSSGSDISDSSGSEGNGDEGGDNEGNDE
ncbi:hypothetical protein DY000_02016778 [Brassica cretica]|uniref:Uncharacterized protein n=1 Tax=Brassica cretica TaxID=69181 RepID=A0ABQ7D334_BRACR|nr:hypothetical protein DY000_02016778 [Brassica cretica]